MSVKRGAPDMTACGRLTSRNKLYRTTCVCACALCDSCVFVCVGLRCASPAATRARALSASKSVYVCGPVGRPPYAWGRRRGGTRSRSELERVDETRELCRREESVLAVTARQRVSLYTNTFDTRYAQAASKSATTITRKAAIQGNEYISRIGMNTIKTNTAAGCSWGGSR